MNIITRLRRYRWYILGRIKIKRAIRDAARKNSVHVVLGASYVPVEGWICTDIPHFNVCKEEDWEYLFEDIKCDRLLSEHVFEHLTPAQVEQAVKMAHQYLKPGGVIRIAMPDEWHTDKAYYEFVKIGGTGLGADDHYSQWNIESLTALLNQAGFEVKPIEYWTKEGKLITNSFSDDDGPIRRSIQRIRKVGGIENYTSLIVDAIKK